MPSAPPLHPTHPACPQVIFERAREFGGGLFALAASVVADLIHHDPLCYRTLDEAGLPQVGTALLPLLHAWPLQAGSLAGPACTLLLEALQCLLHIRFSPPPTRPQAFLDSVAAGVIVSMEAVAAVPNTLMALCLNSGG